AAGPLPAAAAGLLGTRACLLPVASRAGGGHVRSVFRASLRAPLGASFGTGLRGRRRRGFFGAGRGGILGAGLLHGFFWAAFNTRGPHRVLRVLLGLGLCHFGIICLS